MGLTGIESTDTEVNSHKLKPHLKNLTDSTMSHTHVFVIIPLVIARALDLSIQIKRAMSGFKSNITLPVAASVQIGGPGRI